MSLPRRLSLLQDGAGLALKQEPVIATVRGDSRAVSLASGSLVQEAPYELDLQFDASSAEAFGIRIYSDEDHWTEIGFDRQKRQFYSIVGSPAWKLRLTSRVVTKAPVIAERASLRFEIHCGSLFR